MQSGSLAEKLRVEYDSVEIMGFVRMGDCEVSTDTIEVPEFKRTRLISAGIKKIPAIEMTYETRRGTNTLKFFQDFYFKNQVKDVTKIRCDAHGDEFARTALPACECVKYVEVEVDHAAVKYAQVKFTLIPWNLEPIQS